MNMRIIILALVVGVCGFAKADTKNSSLMSADTLVWAGLDYSSVRVIGRSNDIKVPELFVQDMPKKWNDLFLDERIEHAATLLNKRVMIDMQAVTERNQTLATNRTIFETADAGPLAEPNLTRKQIASMISSYKLEHTNGLGLVFIVEKFLYHATRQVFSGNPSSDLPGTRHQMEMIEHMAVMDVVFFNIATRELISVKREVATAGSSGSFRNRWFDPIKTVDSGLGKYR